MLRSTVRYARRLPSLARPAPPARFCTARPSASPSDAASSAPDSATPPPSSAAAAAAEPADAHAAEVERLQAEASSANEKLLRALAEMENVRAIARRDVAQAREYGIAGFARGMLGVADNLGLALRAVPDGAAAEDEALRGLLVGVEATERELVKVLAQNGVHRFGEVGDAFDPERYQALFEAPGGVQGEVVEVAKVGYSIGERVLRPAEVGVAKGA